MYGLLAAEGKAKGITAAAKEFAAGLPKLEPHSICSSWSCRSASGFAVLLLDLHVDEGGV
jgi:hypothetical protein